MAYRPTVATYDSVSIGDRVKRNGFLFYVTDKKEDFIEIKVIPESVYDLSTKDAVQRFTPSAFNAKRILKVTEPPIKTYKI